MKPFRNIPPIQPSDSGHTSRFPPLFNSRVPVSLRGRRLKGKGKGVLFARETRGAREEEGKETPGDHCISRF